MADGSTSDGSITRPTQVAVTTTSSTYNLYPTEVLNTFITTTIATSLWVPDPFLLGNYINGGAAPGVSFEFTVLNNTGSTVQVLRSGGLSSPSGGAAILGSNSLLITYSQHIGRFRIVYITSSTAMIFRVL